MEFKSPKPGDIMLMDESYALKISTAREILVKKPGEKNFTNLEVKSPYGMSQLEKMKYLLELNDRIKKQQEVKK